MVEICCGVVNKSDTSVPCEPSSRAARRRRMEIRRFKFIEGFMEPPENGRKRQKLQVNLVSPPRECENADENCAMGAQHRKEAEAAGFEMNKNSNSNLNESSIQTISNLSPHPPPVAIDPVVLDRCPRFGVTSLCGRRRDMEDAVAIHPSFCGRDSRDPASLHFFGVYDGHGCSHVAISCKDRLHQLVKEELESVGASLEWKDAMERSFSRMDKEVLERSNGVLNANCKCELQTPQCDAVGSTAVVAIVTSDKIVVANCGDSRGVLCRRGKAVPLSTDHKPDRPDELLRIQASGGRVIYWDGPRVLGVLAMSRAIGDNYLKPYVSSEPEVTTAERTAEDEFLILASDGLWDVVSNDMACGIVRMCLSGQLPVLPPAIPGDEVTDATAGESSDKACSDAALLLTKLALARHSTDNVSVVVVNLKKDT